jgi:hypothetical protein
MEFANNSLKSPKIRKLNIDTPITPQGPSIHEKNQTKKSHATVPLNQNTEDKGVQFWTCIYRQPIRQDVYKSNFKPVSTLGTYIAGIMI